MSSFKSVGTNNLVNLFTGDFSYNIPLLDVGGYPVNIYYDGGVSMEQEASWVGLGWNINPGNINRNVRGVPDDFNGNDTLDQVQVMKPNKTWGLGVGGDLELLGIKAPINANLGVAFNNYLGPSLDLALRGNMSFKVAGISGSEKLGAAASPTIGIDVNSRSGASFSGSVSLTANAKAQDNKLSMGMGLSTGYNSRTGIKALQVYEQQSITNIHEKTETYKRAGVPHTYTYNQGGHINESLYSTSISFVKPSYIPSMRMTLTNTAWSGHFQLGLGSYGVAADVEAEVYGQQSVVAPTDMEQKKPMVGYMYAQNAVGNPGYIMDYNRINDREVTPNTPVISVPQYSYDVFSIQGEGTGGSIRAYRGDLGYVRDNVTTSKDGNYSVGGDIDPPGHYGGNFNTINTPSTIGEWNTGNKLRSTLRFSGANSSFENVYFRNPGENAVLDAGRYDSIGGTSLVRFVLGGSTNSPSIEPKLQSFSSSLVPSSTLIGLSHPAIPKRNKRTQVVNFLTAAEASVAGLDTAIKSYDNQTFLDAVTDTLLYRSFSRVDGIRRKAHHISQIDVTENNGRRYVYGLPVYNIIQKDLTFTVDNNYSQIPNKVLVNDPSYITQGSTLLGSSTRDGYVQVTSTPGYAHSFLLTGIVSPDYVDLTGNGISEDDLGEAVKFNYTQIQNGSDSGHRWRSPLTAHDSANFNAGLRSETKDDKAVISYGVRESWYLQSVESKSMIALFYVSNRLDAKGPAGVTGEVSSTDNFVKKLDSIALYNKADLKNGGLAKALPIKTVHFVYSYLLCPGTPDNALQKTDSLGKLTLQSIYFTYNGKTRAFRNHYGFAYNSTGSDNPTDNPPYGEASADRWGTYKPACANPGTLVNRDYPYTIQDSTKKVSLDQQASAWMLKKIVLPSGGQMEISYESDDYAYVQNKRAADMMPVVGFGSAPTYSLASDRLYPYPTPSTPENNYVFIQVPVACSSATEVYNRYLQGLTQLSVRLWVIMPKGPEYLTAYANFQPGNYGVDATNHNVIWIKMDPLAGYSPLSLTALEYLRQQLPGQAFPGYDVSETSGLQQIGDMLVGMIQSLRDAFTDPVNGFRKDGKAMHTDLTKCFARLNDPDGSKYGGGYRVKSVVLRDNWNAMTGQFTASYGQQYNYTTTESFQGATRTISSGVASYEPSIGGEENPWQNMLQFQDDLPAGPSSFGAVEMPIMDAFFPSPVVGYSKVTVTTLKTDTFTAKSRSGIGKQVTEFYTAKDYPVSYSYTPFDAGSVKEFHQASTLAFFNKYAYDYKAQSQGFLVSTNDMHGKMRSQSSYADNDSATRINYTEYFYRNTGVNGMNDTFPFIDKDQGGAVYSGNMGVDIDLMTDTREFAVRGSSMELQGQVDMFYIPLPFPVPTIWPVDGVSENIYRAVTTTKVITYHSVLDSTVVIDKGSQVSTKNMAYDAQTGAVLVTRTNNEFNQPVYSASYPAYWAYGGMGPAYKNIDATYTGVTFSQGKITAGISDMTIFESGDELLILGAVNGPNCDAQFHSSASLIWAYDRNKNATSLITTPDFIFLDKKGNPYTMSNVAFRIIRSGHRNQLEDKVGTVASLDNPLISGKLYFPQNSRVINATAVEFQEKWQVDNDVIKRLMLIQAGDCSLQEVDDTTGNGYLEKSVNPYLKGLMGNFKAYRSRVFYDTRKEYDSTANTNIGTGGQFSNFKLFWDFNTSGNLVPDLASTQWVWNSQIDRLNAKGLQVETKDALGRFTSAQYGYYKTLPVAITENARYTEMFAENFEDYGYGEALDNTRFNTFSRPVDFSKLPNSYVANTDTCNFKAHTGRFVLGVTGLTPVTIPFKPDPGAYTLQTGSTNQQAVVPGPYGGVFTSMSTSGGVKLDNPNATFSQGNQLGGVFYTIQPYIPSPAPPVSSVNYQYLINAKQYFQITTGGTYTLLFQATNNFHTPALSNPFPQFESIAVYDSVNNLTYIGTDQGTTTTSNSLTKTRNFCLPAGVYQLFLGFFVAKNYTCTPSSNNSVCQLTGNDQQYLEVDQYSVNSPSLGGITFWQNYTTVTGCAYTVPMPGTDSMLSKVAGVVPGKKMLFSGWVHESCGDPTHGVSCKLNTYTHNQVQLSFGTNNPNNVTLNPTGSIIDGWQKYEGAFIVPATATGMTMNLVNSGSSPVYFDDIRIQPFNADMKTYVYDPINLHLLGELDANNYATMYEYDEEGNLVRTKIETREGVKTVTESRSALQKVVQ